MPSRTHSTAPDAKRPTRRSSQRSTTFYQKTEIILHVYDLLPPGKLSTLLWTLGSPLLHTGLYLPLLGKEYSFGSHSHAHITGVYHTPPQPLPLRCSLLHGYTFLSSQQLLSLIADVAKLFPGPSYNLLSNNCNHFTSYLCERLTGRRTPRWVNRAAEVGGWVPCLVPKEWISPPELEGSGGGGGGIADAELLVEEHAEEGGGAPADAGVAEQGAGAGERTALLAAKSRMMRTGGKSSWKDEAATGSKSRNMRGYGGTDTDEVGRKVPPSERAPLPPPSVDVKGKR